MPLLEWIECKHCQIGGAVDIEGMEGNEIGLDRDITGVVDRGGMETANVEGYDI